MSGDDDDRKGSKSRDLEVRDGDDDDRKVNDDVERRDFEAKKARLDGQSESDKMVVEGNEKGSRSRSRSRSKDGSGSSPLVEDDEEDNDGNGNGNGEEEGELIEKDENDNVFG